MTRAPDKMRPGDHLFAQPSLRQRIKEACLDYAGAGFLIIFAVGVMFA